MDDFSLHFLHQINKFMCMTLCDFVCILKDFSYVIATWHLQAPIKNSCNIATVQSFTYMYVSPIFGTTWLMYSYVVMEGNLVDSDKNKIS